MALIKSLFGSLRNGAQSARLHYHVSINTNCIRNLKQDTQNKRKCRILFSLLSFLTGTAHENFEHIVRKLNFRS